MPRRDPYFALADPTRRAILELLWERGPLPAGAVAEHFPAISREAVSRHLRILREAELVTPESRGRESWYCIHDRGLAELHEAFFARFAPLFEQSLAALKDVVESPPEPPTSP